MKRFKIDFISVITFIILFYSPFQNKILPFIIVLFIHELGHLIFILMNKIRINYIKITAFGCYIDIDTNNLLIHQEISIYLGGIFFNMISLGFFEGDYLLLTKLIILFNILPIYPLDGYRIIKSLLAYFVSYKKVLYITNIISILTIILVTIFSVNYLDYLLLANIVYLLILNIIEFKNIKMNLESFILNRYLNKPIFKFKNKKLNHNPTSLLMKYHTIKVKIGNKIISENELIDLHYKRI